LPDEVAPPPPPDTAAVDSAPSGGPKSRACVVTLGGRAFAVDVRDAREVVMLDALTVVPGALAPLVGLANLRGNVLAVVEARPLLDLPARPVTPGSPALVLAAGELQAAVAIDRVIGLDWFDTPVPLDATDRRPGAAFAIGLVPHADADATLLDAGRLLEALRAPWAPSAPEA
jgi:twitching motility protein PilI